MENNKIVDKNCLKFIHNADYKIDIDLQNFPIYRQFEYQRKDRRPYRRLVV